MWEGLYRILASLRRRYQTGVEARRADKKRARFWADVREGEREATRKSAKARERDSLASQ
jgi:hypothetical protein